ncbi:PQQ-dependent dehydrogenase, methanol/ethanol family [Methylobacterium frigidaeris]|uniref:Quinohemoprotein alcohol dehydrogenase ADH-IIG n=2 Tax=Methylobacterium frigidaeris TaxID=2038277 RepID=A0AA37H9N9_9HYPH|nr:PQQ-dependent dehydrogenase, methanol/ethanol family [Methylobacterium frigidaeris]GJD61895.1 Quinohemoprotein alcohol dehydrogenase ADH-IIG [Methylobacterium frigidaeris]
MTTSRTARRVLAATSLAALTAGALLGVPALAAEGSVTQERLLNADMEEGNWIQHHKNYAGHRYSTLNQINKGNVKNLKVAWTMHLGGIEGGGIWSHGGLEGTPIVENGMMYVTDGWGSVYKIDTRGGEGKLLWKMDPKTDREWAGAVACCGVNNRGVALWGDLVVSHTLDGRLIATNKESGQVAWQRQVADPDKGETITGAPLIVKGMAISGVGGAEYGIRGWIAATDLKTEKEVWRTHTIPGKGEPGYETWKGPNNAAVSGGGSTWVTGTYDPDTDTIVWGVGNPGPDWDNAYRPGDNLYTDSTLALDATTGKIKWHFQHTPNDPYDYDSVSENLLVDVGGRKLAIEADRNGFGYAVDRTTGQFVWATQFVKKVTWTRGINPDTGKPFEYDPNKDVQRYIPSATPSAENKNADFCPGNMGGKNWPPTAYNPNLQYWYIPVIESCNRVTHEAMTQANLKPREFFTGGGPSQPFRITGSVTAIDVKTGKVAGKHETQFPLLGGMLATPDLVFTGEPSGGVMAMDAKSLDKLWEFRTGGGVNAPPMTFTVDGKQYVAILVGLGGAWDKWFIDSTPELKNIQTGSMLYVFAL